MQMRKMRAPRFIIPLLLALVFILGCSQLGISPSQKELYSCKADSDCVPKPGCHPLECINQRYQGLFKKPGVCTEIFMLQAAYSKEDCACIGGSCINKNLQQKQYTEAESLALATRYLEQSSTYSFDGSGLEHLKTTILGCPSCFSFTFSFASGHPGYGNRSGSAPNRQSTPHTAVVIVEAGSISTAILDSSWDQIKEQYIPGADSSPAEEPDPEKACSTDSDCACGRHTITNQCFYGNAEYVDTTQQCPDFCTGIAANFEIRCISSECRQLRVK
jgi:hypothetical protein